jgi:hypothetical protein
MTDAERRAFQLGHAYAVEQMIAAHDGLLAVAAKYEAALLTITQHVAVVVADEHRELEVGGDPRISAIMGEIRRVRFDGVDEALALFELEQAMSEADR